ncbi:DUF2157 domain-containing protein [Gilvimarinus agarilyticus]|uniref:DUF2157 domain-containing protein n=1 Tax=Gilvimarinus sp. 2_MG-2023 TaxID=3062666 RepID=UPI001C09FA8B|nr:DUF2157 domain-containing protein [Gilvimarinus sp. 2_MG-2023]MBU2887822.1 DUF2157 domain-containing protein [Gilvimarinus agarilyticus]MDO6572460.1 DUF2157 domain-containing protein [Gilvimarinus sp. 2_MG-2023]
MSTRRQQLIELIQQNVIPPADIARAADQSGIRPTCAQWRTFTDRILLTLGILALVFAVLFFIAYNWMVLGRMARFALIEVSIAAAVGVYVWRPRLTWLAPLALLAASILLGVLLGFYGQTYQTGADPWQLFFNWALLMTPWVVLARLPALWLLWLGLWNLSAFLYQSTDGFDWLPLPSGSSRWLAVCTALNITALAVWEMGQRRLALTTAR